MTWRGIAIGFVIGLLTIPLLAWFALKLGYVPVAATASPMPFERYAAKTALHQRIASAAPKNSQIAATESDLLQGAEVYRNSCALCHGLPGRPETAIAAGMFPEPPELLKGKGVTDDPIGHTYWVVKNGIRLSGMPAFRKTLNDQQLWQVASLVANANSLPGTVQKQLEQPDSVKIGDLARQVP